MALEICEDCGQTYEAGAYTHFCKACRNRRNAAGVRKREAAKAARKKEAESSTPKVKTHGGPKLTVLPPAAPRTRPKQEPPKDYISFCAQAAQNEGKSYGAYMANTTKEQRREMWQKIRKVIT